MLEVGIVGGSIAGCFTARELLDAGHRVTVFERSDAELHGLLGAGLGTPTTMFETLVERGLVDRALPQLALVAFHWGDLHRGLRARMPESAYRAGETVATVVQADAEQAVVTLADG